MTERGSKSVFQRFGTFWYTENRISNCIPVHDHSENGHIISFRSLSSSPDDVKSWNIVRVEKLKRDLKLCCPDMAVGRGMHGHGGDTDSLALGNLLSYFIRTHIN